MRFEVTRASYREGPPCSAATRGMVPSWDKRTSASPEQFDVNMRERFSTLPPPWLSEGTEHCLTPDGGIARRREDREAWVIDIGDLDGLMMFVGLYGDVVISHDFRSVPVLKIYDDYIE